MSCPSAKALLSCPSAKALLSCPSAKALLSCPSAKALLSCLLIACTLETEACKPGLTFRTDGAFTGEETGEIVRAAESWNAVTKVDIKLRRDDQGVWYVAKEAPPSGGWNGETRRSERRVYIRPGANVYTVAMHEFGHMLGLRHLCVWPGATGEAVPEAPTCVAGNPIGVMDPATATGELSERDLQECRDVGAC